MIRDALTQFKTAFMLLLLMITLTGLIYPLLVTGVAQMLFPWQANGSLLEDKTGVRGSLFIGQLFQSSAYFWGRPSETKPYPYNGIASSGSNMGPTSPTFLKTIQNRVDTIKLAHSNNNQSVPVDLITASASGLDPEISPYAAFYQATRIAQARHLPEATVRSLIDKHIQSRTLFLLGEPRINVLQLNLALDAL
jgi:K+-transporting ATPase ATPase C chain